MLSRRVWGAGGARHSKLGGGSIGDGIGILGSILTKLKVVLLELCGVEALFGGL